MRAGEHILKLLIEENARIDNGDRWLVIKGLPLEFIVFERKYGQRKTRTLIETYVEKEACRILKGEEDG